MNEPKLIVEEINDPAYAKEFRAGHERALRNSKWLEANWPSLLPAARGRFIAVAGEEAFVADTVLEAWALAKAAHPEDDGALAQFVPKDVNPRIYANTWRMVPV